MLPIDRVEVKASPQPWVEYIITVSESQSHVRRAYVFQTSLIFSFTDLTSLVMINTLNYRIACYYFVLGVDRYSEKKVEDSVQLLTMSYIINQKLIDQPLECGGTQETKVSKAILTEEKIMSREKVAIKVFV